nr:undecaprenyl-diphosphate phosphatase [Bacilli bacterium]
MIHALLIGFVQGITEFLPISSSGHLVLMSKVLKIGSPSLAEDVMMHGGTLLSVLLYYRKAIWLLLTKNKVQLGSLLIATIPTLGIAALFRSYFALLFASGQTLGLEFILTGCLLLFSETLPVKRTLSSAAMNVWQAMAIGIAQGAAIMPAISRSAMTIATGRIVGLAREEAVSFSFLLSIPIIAISFVVSLMQGELQGYVNSLTGWVAFFTAFLSGYLAISLINRWIRRRKLTIFGYYTLGLGLLITADLWFFHYFF